MPGSMTPLATLTLSSAQATVTFSSITGTYRDLRLVIVGKNSAGADQPYLQANSDTGSNYYICTLEGSGTGTASYASALNGFYTAVNYNNFNSTSPTVLIADFLDYSVTDKQKSVLMRSNSSSQAVAANVTRWANTAAITSLAIKTQASTFAAGSTFTLYGVSA
jgi:hypothetical protein